MVNINRGKMYNWFTREREDRLEDKRPVANRMSWKLKPEKVIEVLRLIDKYKEIATDYVIGIKSGLAASTVNKIKKMYLAPKQPDEPEMIIKGSYQWPKRNICWSMDTMQVRFMGGWLYVMLVIEETSRMVLGYMVMEKKRGIYARELLLRVTDKMKKKPLVVKHDRGVEFENEEFQDMLKELEIVSLPSPGHYAPFNSVAERSVRLVRRFTGRLEARYDTALYQVENTLSRAQQIINYEMPRKIFTGRSSYDVYQTTKDYEEQERIALIKDLIEKQRVKEGLYHRSGKILDKHREEVVEYLCQKNLCCIRYEVKTKKQIC